MSADDISSNPYEIDDLEQFENENKTKMAFAKMTPPQNLMEEFILTDADFETFHEDNSEESNGEPEEEEVNEQSELYENNFHNNDLIENMNHCGIDPSSLSSQVSDDHDKLSDEFQGDIPNSLFHDRHKAHHGISHHSKNESSVSFQKKQTLVDKQDKSKFHHQSQSRSYHRHIKSAPLKENNKNINNTTILSPINRGGGQKSSSIELENKTGVHNNISKNTSTLSDHRSQTAPNLIPKNSVTTGDNGGDGFMQNKENTKVSTSRHKFKNMAGSMGLYS